MATDEPYINLWYVDNVCVHRERLSGCEDVAGWELRFSGDSDAEVGRGRGRICYVKVQASKAAGSAKGADAAFTEVRYARSKKQMHSKGKNARIDAGRIAPPLH